jgi:hypothetical protein
MDLLKLNRDQLRWVVGLLTGHCHLKGHHFKMGLTDDPTCERCLEEDESATHILRDWEVIADLRFHHLGQFFMDPSDYYDAPISIILHLIRSVGLKKGYSKGKHNRSLKVAVQGPDLMAHPLDIHRYKHTHIEHPVIIKVGSFERVRMTVRLIWYVLNLA